MTTIYKKPLILESVGGKLVQSQSDELALTTISGPASGDLQINPGANQSIKFGTDPGAASLTHDGVFVAASVADSVGTLAAVRDDLSTLSGTVSSQGTRLTTAEDNITTLQGDVSTLQTDVGNLQDSVGQLQTDVSSLQGDVSTLQGEVDNINSTISGYGTSFTTGDLTADTATIGGNSFGDLYTQVQGFATSFASDAITANQSLTVGTSADGVYVGPDYFAINVGNSAVLTMDSNGTVTANGGDFHVLSVSTTPTNANDVANKSYVDSRVNGIFPHEAVKLMFATQQNQTGLPSQGDYTLVDGDRVLLTNNDNPLGNGAWVAHSGAWTRPTDFAAGSHQQGATFAVTNGTFANNRYFCASIAPNDVVDTDALTFLLESSFHAYTGTQGVAVSGDTIQAALATNSGLSKSSGLAVVAADASISVGSSGIAVQLDGATLSTSGSGLSVAGLPAQFSIDGTAVSQYVDADSLSLLVANADGSINVNALHDHFRSVTLIRADGTITAGKVIAIDHTSGRAVHADCSAANKQSVLGIALNSASAGQLVNVQVSGYVPSISPTADMGSALYVGTDGALTSDPGSGAYWIRVGYVQERAVGLAGGKKFGLAMQDMGYVA